MITIQTLEEKFKTPLQLVKGKSDLALQALCSPQLLLASGLVIIKDKKLIDSLNEVPEKMTVVLSSKHWESLKDHPALSKFQNIFTIDDPAVALAKWSEEFFRAARADDNDFVDGRQMGTAKIHPTALIAQNVFIGKNVVIGANTKIASGSVIYSHSVIGDNCEIYSNVTIYQNVHLGNHCRIHAGTVIGADGFGYVFHQGSHLKIWHFGGARLGNYVEIGANSCVDGGTFSPTLIGNGTKLDNHVQIGHNCQLGTGVIICGHVAIGGSTKIGDYTVFGGKSGSGDNYNIGAQCQIAGGALVNCDWPDKSIVGGHPARPLKEWMRGLAYLRKVSLRESEKKQ
ncbi:MAG: UDP-3-O-(3-hydroxymyristoyl)glucosamine N-acyltransferase [Bdellovibrio sp. CG12_big_fil_rev_8_21_14_0_65_39_13]|nr:MAG: UDP-3-O-(3-hydroxymyristoyl)glucosamine N-acyltransferase [Bdellovibrio sp. CG22_combo_CG10-13_8_21_14_all_39_27]PIQ58494.1 MAG: UDP-3-O-(3-hydroxymyristoyl)glucosamine N-acyltransferase [Bdellovibrio sp. CG12_big_fil_rev_8_21_14_0_65_39_13]PIR35446.1 MAG: UDP-3-O-(3-hydroxymyristoyl)glucosamine N-acyltransferase [Bdellovibrio sp. CG11_big_fil_rev_8_21_14_0_20_39_38]